jgi:hypothetical protein
MKIKMGRGLQYYYFLILSCLLVALMGGGCYFWSASSINSDNVSSLVEASITLDEIKKLQDGNRPDQSILFGKQKEFSLSMDRIEKGIRAIDQVKHLASTYRPLENALNEVKIVFNAPQGLPEINPLLDVLTKKITDFSEYVNQNNWRTLSRMSGRMLSEIRAEEVRRNGNIDFERLNSMIRNVVRSVAVMRNVTQTSLLSASDKNIILAKLGSFSIEIGLLEKYPPEIEKIRGSFTKFVQKSQAWMKEIAPEITYKKIQYDRNSKNLIFCFTGLLLFLLASMVTGVMVYQRGLNIGQRKLEKSILESVRDGIILPDDRLQGRFSSLFRTEMDKCRAQVHGRMSFGAIFQEGVPFPSVLLDSNLNLVWANRLFYEHWNMLEYLHKDEKINWDFLQRFTNLGENDPVVEGLRQKVAGIYQIQVRAGHNKETLPYEMYVSPVEYGGQNRVMIFFYPLRSLEQTLHEQKKALVAPVCKSLDALTQCSFTAEFASDLTPEFVSAGIDVIHEKFIKFHTFYEEQQQSFLREIERLEAELSDAQKLIADMKQIIDQEEEMLQKCVPYFKSSKESIIELVDVRKDVEQLCLNAVAGSKNLLQEEMNLLALSSELEGVVEENIQIFDNMSGCRQDFRSSRKQIEDCRSTLVQTIDQAMILKKTERWCPEKMEQILGRIKIEVKAFESVLQATVKLLMAQDVQLSKLQMITENHKKADVGAYRLRFEDLREKIENCMFQMTKLTRRGDQADKGIIGSLKELFSNYSSQKEAVQKLNALLSGEEIENLPEKNSQTSPELIV